MQVFSDVFLKKIKKAHVPKKITSKWYTHLNLNNSSWGYIVLQETHQICGVYPKVRHLPPPSSRTRIHQEKTPRFGHFQRWELWENPGWQLGSFSKGQIIRKHQFTKKKQEVYDSCSNLYDIYVSFKKKQKWLFFFHMPTFVSRFKTGSGPSNGWRRQASSCLGTLTSSHGWQLPSQHWQGY